MSTIPAPAAAPSAAADTASATRPLRLGLPKGRMKDGVFQLLADAGLPVVVPERGYRPMIGLDGVETKLLKPQNVVEMLHYGSRDLGFAGADWVAELEADVVEVLDTGLDRVRVVAAAPEAFLVDGALPKRPMVVVSEYERLTRDWIERSGLQATFVRSYGATEAFPPEDGDCIVDNTSTGSTLRENGLQIVDEVMTSSTRLYANRAAMDDPVRRGLIEHVALLLRSVLEARERVMLEVNVAPSVLDAVVEVLPCMKNPTIARLHEEEGYAVKAAVRRSQLPEVIPLVKARGGTDIVVSSLEQIVP